MQRIMVIDDERYFGDMGGWTTYCRTSVMAIAQLRNHKNAGLRINQLWLDHDLGDDDTIMPVVDELCEKAFNNDPYDIEVIYVHSMNPVGSIAMVKTLIRYGYNVVRTGLPQTVEA